ncbi:MAG TPA: hypothetical protein VNC82_03895 [Candidatus Limnocylindria bacterium]|nr:hypothetical protein [Candidatus Limnocylindria bacterium]
MSLLKLALLLAVYVSLDFSNPMMPGAVSFDTAKSVEGRPADRGREVEADAGGARLPAVAPLRHAAGAPAVTGRARPAPRGAPVWQAHVPRSYPSASVSTAPAEDH